MAELSETKELIFDAFIELTSALGYETVSMRDIARKVGIKVPSIYNHFEGKHRILEYVYDYYKKHYFDNRKPIEEMKKLIETAPAPDIIRTFARTYETDDQKKYVRMILITKIINMRIFQDPAANTIFDEHNKDDIGYVINVLQHGVDQGRIDPSFDLETFAIVLIDSYTMMGIKAFAQISYQVGQLDQEKSLLAMLSRLLASAIYNGPVTTGLSADNGAPAG